MASHHFPALKLINQSTVYPYRVIQKGQKSGFQMLLGGANPATGNGGIQIGIKEGDKMVYVQGIGFNNETPLATQGSSMQLPSVNFTTAIAGTRVLLLQARAVYDHHDLAAASNYGIALPNALDLAHNQGFAQYIRSLALFGLRSDEGILNQAPHISIGADTNGQTTIRGYNAGQLAMDVFVANASLLQQRMFNLGNSASLTILAPQRVLSKLLGEKVVQLFSYQMPGGGTNTSGSMVNQFCQNLDITVNWVPDDTLVEAGAMGVNAKKDLIVLSIPEIEPYNGAENFDTNEFSKLEPNLIANNLMLVDRALPTKTISPLAGGAVDVLYEMNAMCGLALRPEATVVIEMEY